MSFSTGPDEPGNLSRQDAEFLVAEIQALTQQRCDLIALLRYLADCLATGAKPAMEAVNAAIREAAP